MRKIWFHTPQCQNGYCCKSCRTDQDFRKDLRANWGGIDADDFECPWGVKEIVNGKRPVVLMHSQTVIRLMISYQQLLEDHSSGKSPLKDCDVRFFKGEVDRLSEKLKTARMNFCNSA